MRTWLLFDCTYLSHRAFHSTGGLKYEGMPTGVLFGVIMEIERLLELYNPIASVMAFDYGGPGLRGELEPSYKLSRRQQTYTDEEIIARRQFFEQIEDLKNKHLPSMGFNNIFCVEGYEGDDILAQACLDIPRDDDGIIVTGDNDLWQCIDQHIQWYSPRTKKTMTFEMFREEFGLDPVIWANIKALAGCSTDDVEGIKGIGEITAAKWFTGKLKPSTVAFGKITKNIDVTMAKNMPLTKLPFSGMILPTLVPDDVTEPKKTLVKERLGIRSRRRRKTKEPNTEISGFDI